MVRKTRKKMEVLNLALVHKDVWQELVCEAEFSAEKVGSRFEEGRWYYRGELEVILGRAQLRLS